MSELKSRPCLATAWPYITPCADDRRIASSSSLHQRARANFALDKASSLSSRYDILVTKIDQLLIFSYASHGCMEQGMTPRSRKALIIGAGIAGPVTAMFLTRAGIEAELYEAWPYSTGIGGGLQIAPNGMHVLAELGLADELIRTRLDRRVVRFLFAERQEARLAQPEHAAALRPARGEHVPRDPERDADRQGLGLATSRCSSRSGWSRSRTAATSRSIAYFADGTTAEGDFVIGADGVHSVVRRACDPRRPDAVRHRPARLRRLRAAQDDRASCRSARRWRRRSGKAASSATGCAAPIRTRVRCGGARSRRAA